MFLRTRFHAMHFGTITPGTFYNLRVWYCAFFTVPLSSLGWTMMWMVQTGSRMFDSSVSSDLNTELSGCWLSPLLLTHVSILHAAKWCGHALKTSDSDANINSIDADEKTCLRKLHLLVKTQTNAPLQACRSAHTLSHISVFRYLWTTWSRAWRCAEQDCPQGYDRSLHQWPGSLSLWL